MKNKKSLKESQHTQTIRQLASKAQTQQKHYRFHKKNRKFIRKVKRIENSQNTSEQNAQKSKEEKEAKWNIKWTKKKDFTFIVPQNIEMYSSCSTFCCCLSKDIRFQFDVCSSNSIQFDWCVCVFFLLHTLSELSFSLELPLHYCVRIFCFEFWLSNRALFVFGIAAAYMIRDTISNSISIGKWKKISVFGILYWVLLL